MATERRVSFIIGANAKQFYSGLNKASKRFKRFGRKMRRVGSNLTHNLSTPLALAGGASVKMAVDFERSMTKINTLVGLSTDQVDVMKSSVIELSNQTGKSSKELASALFAVTSAGLRGQEALQVLEQSAKASAVGLGETKQIARTTTAIINAYGKENINASEATDKLTAIVREGNLEAEELAGSLGRVLGPASQLGVSFDEVGASIATYTRLGVSSEEASTGLRSILNSLIKTTPKQQKAFQDLGTSADEVRKRIGEEGLANTLTDLISRADGNIEVLGQLIPNVRALSTVLGTAGSQGEQYNQIVKNIADSTDLVNEGFKETEKDAGQKLAKAFRRLQNLGIQIGAKLIPVLNNLIDKVNVVFDWFGSLSNETQTLSIVIAGIVAGLGPAISLFGTLATVIGAVISPVGVVIAGIAGLIVIGKNLVDNWEVIKAEFAQIWEGIKLMIMESVNFIVKANAFLFDKILGFIQSFASATGNTGLAESVITAQGLIKTATDQVNQSLEEQKEKYSEATREAEKQRENIVSLKESFFDLGDTLGGYLTQLGDYIGLTDQSTISTEKLIQAQKKVLGLLKNGVQKSISTPSTFGTSPEDAVGGRGLDDKKATSKFDSISDAVKSAHQTTREFSEDLANNLTPMISKALGNATGSFLEMSVTAIASGQSMKGAFTAVLSSLADLAIKVGKIAIATGLAIEGIKKALQSLNPVAAIAAGAALIALGSVVKARLKAIGDGMGNGDGVPQMAKGGIIPDGFSNDTYPALLSSGEMVVPKPHSLPGGIGKSQDINLSGEFRVKGTDLVMVLERAKRNTLR